MAVIDVFNPLGNVTPRFPEAKLEEISQWFDSKAKPLLVVSEDQPPLKVVTVEHFVAFLDLKKFHKRSFNYPTYKEIMIEVEKLQAGVTRMLTKEQCLYILNTRVLEPQIKHEMFLAFQLFDTEKRNYLEIDEIEVIITSYGNGFDEDETREILRDADVRGDGRIYYADFVESLFSTTPELYELKAEYLYDDPEEDPSCKIPPKPVKVKASKKKGKGKKGKAAAAAAAAAAEDTEGTTGTESATPTPSQPADTE